MRLAVDLSLATLSRTPYGVRGLKYHTGYRSTIRGHRRTPYGVRGLKF